MQVSRNLSEVKELAKVKIDTIAEEMRLQFVTPGSAQAMIYQEKQREANEYIKNAQLLIPIDNNDYPFVLAESQINNITMSESAQIISNLAFQWKSIGAAIEFLRLSAKRQIDDSTKASDVLNLSNSLTWAALNALLSA